MALLRRLASSSSLISKKSLIQGQFQAFSTRSCNFSTSYSADQHGSLSRLEDEDKRNYHEFEKWHNGGGMFHKSACIDPTALVELGAVIHSRSLVGANVHIGSGAIIGPDVILGQSTNIGIWVLCG